VLASHWSAAPLFLALNSQRLRDVGFSTKDSRSSVSRRRRADYFRRTGIQGDGVWLSGDSAKAKVETIGRSLDATAYSPLDIIGLHAATGADIRDLVTDESSRRRGGDSRDRRRDRG